MNFSCMQKPDTQEADFCSDCIIELLDSNIPYEKACKLYKSK